MFVIAVVFRGDKFLMVYNPHRGWEFPGGKVEEGEDCPSAALRELREEAGVVGNLVAQLPSVSGACVYLFEFTGYCCEGEFKSKFFEDLPENLSYPEYEARIILKFSRKLR